MRNGHSTLLRTLDLIRLLTRCNSSTRSLYLVLLHVISWPLVGFLGSLRYGPVVVVALHLALLAVQQVWQHATVRDVDRRRYHGESRALLRTDAYRSLQSDVPLVALLRFFVWCISKSLSPHAFSIDIGACMIVASRFRAWNTPVAILMPLAPRCMFAASCIMPHRSCFSNR